AWACIARFLTAPGGYVVNRGKLMKQSAWAIFASAFLCASPVLAQVDPTLPDLVPMGLRDFVVSTSALRCGGMKALEFEILTANIGGQDWTRPERNPGVFRMPQIYQYTLYNYQEVGTDPNTGDPVYDYVLVDLRRKNTICTIDDGGRGNVFPCIQ